jgi:hypothetical protein
MEDICTLYFLAKDNSDVPSSAYTTLAPLILKIPLGYKALLFFVGYHALRPCNKEE